MSNNNSEPSSSNEQTPSQLEKTLAKQYQFDAKSLFIRANNLVKDNFSSLFQASLVLFITLVLLGAIAQQFITVYEDGTYSFEHESIIEITAIVVLAPLITGLYMMGVSHARGHKTSVFSLFHYIPALLILALTHLVNNIIVQLGLVLLIVPGVYLWMATSFSLMLVADKSLTPIRAIILSCRVFNAYWSKLITIFAIFFLIFLTVPMTLGLSLIWVLPLYFSMLGLLYQELIGEEHVSTDDSQPQTNESSFDA